MSRTKLQIHTWPESILRKRCRKVDKVDDEINLFLDEMCAFMRVNSGAGLAASQVGVKLRLVVAEWEDRTLKLINPCIKKKKGTVVTLEGCLSFPGLEMEVKRFESISVAFLDCDGKTQELDLGGMLSIIIQHEIDHINGIVFINRISFLKKRSISSKLEEITRRAKNGLPK